MPQESTEKKVVGRKKMSKEYYREWRKKNPEKYKANYKKKNDKLYRDRPWLITHSHIIARCCNPKKENYHRYGGRGIKALITKDELKFLWFRDKAYLMERPSIDRENNDGNYCLENCRFIELSLNSSRARAKPVNIIAKHERGNDDSNNT